MILLTSITHQITLPNQTSTTELATLHFPQIKENSAFHATLPISFYPSIFQFLNTPPSLKTTNCLHPLFPSPNV